jgi:hypothetical protein
MTWNDSEGRKVNPFGTNAGVATVFLFVRTDCPISNRYAPEIERLYSTYGSRGIVFWLVYPDADTRAEDIKNHQREYQLSLPALRDPDHRLVKEAGAKVTPEAAVFLGGCEVYRGRIDDRYADLGQERLAPTTHDLEDAIRAVLAGATSQRTTLAVGCYILE